MRAIYSSLAILISLFLLASALSQDAPTRNTTRGYPTPQAAFHASREALRKRDYATFFHCLTPELQRIFVFETLFASETAPLEKSDAIKAITKKHIQSGWQKAFEERYRAKFGIDYATARQQQARDPAIKLPDHAALSVDVLADHIPDHVGFFVEMSKLLSSRDTPPPFGNHLSNVVITGDTAIGITDSQTESIGSDGRGPPRAEIHRYEMPIRFQCINGGWFLDAN